MKVGRFLSTLDGCITSERALWGTNSVDFVIWSSRARMSACTRAIPMKYPDLYVNTSEFSVLLLFYIRNSVFDTCIVWSLNDRTAIVIFTACHKEVS